MAPQSARSASVLEPDRAGAADPVRLGLVIEDQAEIRAWLCACVARTFPDMAIIGVASLRGARQWLKAYEEDSGEGPPLTVALIDLGLPDGSGVEMIEQIVSRHSTVIPIVATVYDDDAHLFEALAAGAQGYLLKDLQDEALIRSLEAIARGEPALSPAIAHRILQHFHKTQAARPSADVLTARETEVLAWLGRGLTGPETARKLGLTDHTTASYVKTIYSKLNISSRAEAALEAQRRGLV